MRLIFVLINCLVVSLNAQAETIIPESDLKAALLGQIKEYIEWPDNRSRLNVFYLGDDDLYWKSLITMSKRNAGKKTIKLNRVQRIQQIADPDMVVLSNSHASELQNLNKLFGELPTLLVSERVKDQRIIGINFETTPESTIRFQLNRYNLVFQGLKINEEIVILGGSETDIATMVKEMSLRLSESTEVINKLNERVHQLSYSITRKQQELDAKNDELESLSRDLVSAQEHYQLTIGHINEELENARQNLNQTAKQLESKQAEIVSKQQTLKEIESEKSNLAVQISENQDKILSQTKTLNNLQNNLETKEQALAFSEREINLKNQILYISAALLLISITMTLIIWRQFSTKQKLNLKLNSQNLDLKNINQQLIDTQEQLVESKKMASLAGLVTGIAHEVNTPLGAAITAITNLSSLAAELLADFNSGTLRKSEFDSKFKALLLSSDITFKNLIRAADLIKSFKLVSADQVSENARDFELISYIEGVTTSLYHEIKLAKVEVTIECDEKIHVFSYPGILSQVLTNLVMNSIVHAFEKQPNPSISISVVQHNDTIILHYKDNGKGIAEELSHKIFDPFFTTNRSAGCSGLGLHICYNFMSQKMNGSIKCLPSQSGVFFELKFATHI